MNGSRATTLRVRKWSALARAMGRCAPVVTIAIFLTAAALPSHRAATGDARHAWVVEAFERVPLRLGRWIGREVPVPTEATEILSANALLSREYREIGGNRAVTLALIHCSDVRDMMGHHPPVCYPASGWQPDAASEGDAFDVALPGGARMPMRLYRFVRADRAGGLRVMTVLNGFILPDGGLVSDMALLRDRAERRARSAEGVAQIQLVVSGQVGREEARRVAEELLAELPDEVLRSVGVRIAPPVPAGSSSE